MQSIEFQGMSRHHAFLSIRPDNGPPSTLSLSPPLFSTNLHNHESHCLCVPSLQPCVVVGERATDVGVSDELLHQSEVKGFPAHEEGLKRKTRSGG